MADVFAVGVVFSLLICALAFVPLTLVLVLLFLWFLFPVLALLSGFSVEGSCAVPRLVDAGVLVGQNAHLDIFRCLLGGAQVVEYDLEHAM